MENLTQMKNQDKLKLLNELLISAERDKVFMSTDKFLNYDEVNQLKHIGKIKIRMSNIEILNDEINHLLDYAPDISNKLYLAQIIEKEKPKFDSNNLILAPVGSGKSTLIFDHLIENKEQTVLMLVSNNALKDSIAPADKNEREKMSNGIFTTQYEKYYTNKLYKVHLMTYSEFGSRVYVDNSFLDNIHQIFCDEIHSLPEYINYGSKTNKGLVHAQKTLFNPQKGKQIFYFTATNENLLKMEKNHPGTLDCVKIFDYRKHDDIRRYVPRASREITHIEQMRQYLLDRKLSFKYYNYKGMAFSRTIGSLKEIERIVVEEGYNPLVLWSNKNDKNELTNEQVRARNELLATGKIPEPYNFLIFNSALQEGWNLKDNSVKLAIINTMNETEFIQSLGRLRRDVDLLVYKTDKKTTSDLVIVPEEYLDIRLNMDLKTEISEKLNILNDNGIPMKWPGVKKVLRNNGYEVRDTQVRIEGKATKVSIISSPENK